MAEGLLQRYPHDNEPLSSRLVAGVAAVSQFDGRRGETAGVLCLDRSAVDCTGFDIDYRSKLLSKTDALEKTSKDLYASIRLIKAQLRAKLVEEGKAGRVSGDEVSSAEAADH